MAEASQVGWVWLVEGIGPVEGVGAVGPVEGVGAVRTVEDVDARVVEGAGVVGVTVTTGIVGAAGAAAAFNRRIKADAPLLTPVLTPSMMALGRLRSV
jgi:hypothetical protein